MQKLYEDIKQIIKDEKRISQNESVLLEHSKDITYHQSILPDIVVYPKTETEIVNIVKYASKRSISIVPFGAGSSVEGHIIPVKKGIVLDMSLMDDVIEVDAHNKTVTVSAGVTRDKLNKRLKVYGLYFPIDPGADATLGGMAATNASGTNTLMYGTMSHQVLGLELITPDGRIVKTGGNVVKSSSGYNLTSLFVGSEGTLGTFTKLVLKVYGIPEKIVTARVSFPSLEKACNTAIDIISSGVSVSKLEIADESTIEAVNDYKQTDYDEMATLFIEFIGLEHWLEEDVKTVEWLANENKCHHFITDLNSLEENKLWEARHHAVFAVQAKYSGKQPMSTDVCVPISSLTESLNHSRELLNQYNLDGAIFGHVGDGNYHVVFMVDQNDPEDIKLAKEINEQIVLHALSNGGTCTGEHGIGLGKIEFLKKEHSDSYHLMKAIKDLIDPHNIMNPGKVFEL